MAKIRLEIITAERVVYADEVDAVVAPGVEGELGILPRHAPLLTLLQVGELRVRKGSDETYIAISGGFMEVRSDKVVVLAETAERAEEIDMERTEAARQRAQALLAQGPPAADAAQAASALRRSLLRLKVARRRRGAPEAGR